MTILKKKRAGCSVEVMNQKDVLNGHARPKTKGEGVFRDKSKAATLPPTSEIRRSETSSASTSDERVSRIVEELRGIQRRRVVVQKTRIMIENRLRNVVASQSGFYAAMSEDDREKVFKEAKDTIKKVMNGEMDHPFAQVISLTSQALNPFHIQEKEDDKKMVELASQLPVAPWAQQPEQRGFGLLSLAIVVGEAGDLSNYSTHFKLWKRFGCAPFMSDGKTYMGSTWRSGKHGNLSSSEWEDFGYCKRRRAIAHVISANLLRKNYLGSGVGGKNEDDCQIDFQPKKVKGGKGSVVGPGVSEAPVDGPYRLKYLESKEDLQKRHPEYPKGRCHLHGMLLSVKLLLKDLWREWRDASGGDRYSTCNREWR